MTRPPPDVEPQAAPAPEGEPLPSPRPAPYAVASHTALFATPEELRCDACGDAIPGDADEGYGPPGEGVYMWTRGTEVRFEKAPLCASCASAIGMAALTRWEIEEEEG